MADQTEYTPTPAALLAFTGAAAPKLGGMTFDVRAGFLAALRVDSAAILTFLLTKVLANAPEGVELQTTAGNLHVTPTNLLEMIGLMGTTPIAPEPEVH